MRHRLVGMLVAFGAIVALPVAALAQSGIAGVVRDASGGVLPGVTVEAASPALIEKVRTVSTDDQGRYNIVDLRPGTYDITFTLPGFTTVTREGLVLPAAFTATANAEMAVGGLEETLTVTSEAPLIDVQRTENEVALSTELLDATPSPWRNVMKYTALIPGVTIDEGGTGRGLAIQAARLAIHGGLTGEASMFLDGVSARHGNAGGARYMPNQAMVQEVTVSIAGGGAEQDMGGIQQNVIQKSGGNTFSGTMYFHYLNESFSGENVTTGAGSTKLIKSWDINPGVGGPIIRDKLWFYGAYQQNGNEVGAGVRYNLTPLGFQYTPDLSLPDANNLFVDTNYAIRLTWQATPRNQFIGFYSYNPRYWYSRGSEATRAPEASSVVSYDPNIPYQILWKAPLTSRVLIDGNVTYFKGEASIYPSTYESNVLLTGSQKGTVRADPIHLSGVLDQTRNIEFRSSITGWGSLGTSDALRSAWSLTYATGTHTARIGWDFSNLDRRSQTYRANDMSFRIRDGIPNQLTTYVPQQVRNRVKADTALYVQDRWTKDRFTANLGLRYIYFNAYAEAQDTPASRFVPARHFDAVKGIPIWHDLTPRVGLAYDLFGDGKTALKGTWNRYVNQVATEFTNTANPVTTSVVSATRTWNDSFFPVGDGRRGNFEPDCDFSNLQPNGECGISSDLNFGQNNPFATRQDPSIANGFGVRGNQTETSVALQHQLLEPVSVNVGYYRRTFGNFTVTKNTALGDNPATYYDPYCVTLPTDARLPGGGGNQVCGYYDVSVAGRAIRAQNLITKASNYGDQTQVYNGFDVGFNARFARGQFGGGSSTGRSVTNRCFMVNSPQELQFCESNPPLQTQVKFNGVYELPWRGIRLSGNFRSNPGVLFTTTYVATNAEIARTLGRNLSAGATSTVNLPVVAPESQHTPQYNVTDLRLSKIFRGVGNSEWTASLDVFNAFNSNGAVAVQNQLGDSYRLPSATVNARYFKASFQFNF